MKQSIILSMVALSALTVFSCSKSQDALDTPVKGKVLVAYTDDNVNTRTALQNEVNVIWNSTDAITAFDFDGNGHNSQSITVDSQNASKATFQFGDDISLADDIFCALYPADASATMNENYVILTTLPVSQVATAGSFGPGANIALADGLTEDLHFSNGGALLSFTVNNDNVKKVTLTVSGSYNVAGPVYANMDNSGNALLQSTYASQIKSVSLEGDFVNGSDYYFVVLPGEYTGLQLDIENAEGKVATLKNRNTLSLNRNDNIYIANLPDLTAKWEADTPSLPEKVFFKETFGGEDNSLATGNASFKSDNEGWVVEKAYLAGTNGHSARFGTGSDKGVATTPSISIDSEYNGQPLTLSFKAAAWNNDANTLILSASGATLSASSVTLQNNEWSDYEITITNWTSPFTITFSGKNKSNSRFFLDDVCVYYEESQPGGGNSYTITFKTGSGDGSAASTSTACSAIVSDGAQYLSGNLVTATKVYAEGSNGLKLGASSNAGVLKMNLASPVTPISIVVKAKLYNSSKSATLKVNGSAAQAIPADFTDLTFSITSEISYLELESSKYCWIQSVTVKY